MGKHIRDTYTLLLCYSATLIQMCTFAWGNINIQLSQHVASLHYRATTELKGSEDVMDFAIYVSTG